MATATFETHGKEAGCILFSCCKGESHSTKTNLKLLTRRLKTLYKPEKLDVPEINADSIAHAQVGVPVLSTPHNLAVPSCSCLAAPPRTSAPTRRPYCRRLWMVVGRSSFSLPSVRQSRRLRAHTHTHTVCTPTTQTAAVHCPTSHRSFLDMALAPTTIA